MSPHPPTCSKYKYFIFLNSSVRGPFVPPYMPEGWQWTRAYTDRLVGDVKAVSSSLVCLPEVDAGEAEGGAFLLTLAARALPGLRRGGTLGAGAGVGSASDVDLERGGVCMDMGGVGR